MKFKKVNENNFVIRLEKGDKIIESLLEFCKQNSVKLGYFNGIGALDKVELMHYNLNNKKYSNKIIQEPLEIINIYGNIATMDNEPYIHSHIVVSDDKMNAIAGHLKEGIISATCEIFLFSLNEKVERKHNEEIGLNLLDI